MNTFKLKLREAIKSVVKEINSMSKQEFRQELNRAKNSDRARSLFYAWNPSFNKSFTFKGCYTSWQKLSVDVQSFGNVAERQPESLFKDERKKCIKKDAVAYEQDVPTGSSDDYFTFRAAA